MKFIWGKVMKIQKHLSTAMALVMVTTLSACGSSADDKPAATAKTNLEKPVLKLGFIKLTDMAPLAIAKEKGFFAEEGLTVTLEPQANWKVLLDGVIGGQLDGAHMLAGQPIAASIGLGGNAITLSNKVYAMLEPTLPKGTDGKPVHPISAASLKPISDKLKAEGKPLKMGMVFPVSPHNYELRYWLAAGGIQPGYYLPKDVAGTTGADVQLSVTPPPQMPSTMEAGTIDGYSVGEPWNQAAVAKKIGVPVITDHDIAAYNPEKVLGLTKAFVEANPKTVNALLRAIIKAQMWLDADNGKNRAEAVKILSRPNYVGADEKVIASSMTGNFTYAPGDTRPAPEFNIFFNNFAGYPYYSDAVWYLTQMRRWGQIPEAKTDSWYADTAKSVYRPDLYMAAAKSLVAENKAPASAFPETDGYRADQGKFIDGVTYNGKAPNAYLESLKIGLRGTQTVTAAGVK
jgi:nitrate/nitrite transport system substrate-binding protein